MMYFKSENDFGKKNQILSCKVYFFLKKDGTSLIIRSF